MRANILSTQLGGIANLALIAPVKPGFVEGFETVTYARRLETLLKTLNAIRLASRESSLTKSPFPDAVGRFGILQSFRYAIVPPEIGALGEPEVASGSSGSTAPRAGLYRLSLNVTFDGGWEPYMRVIYRDLGTLLDAIFCNCVGYLDSHTHSFDEYTRWVRQHELAGGLFYTESSMTVLDQRYLSGVERIQREQGNPGEADAESAGFAVKEPPDTARALAAFFTSDKGTQDGTLRQNLRALKALNDLRPLYPANAESEDQYLLRFSRRVMREFVALLGARLTDDAPPEPALMPFQEAIKWVMTRPVALPAPNPRPAPEGKVQAGIVSRYDGITQGRLVLLRVTDAAKARQTLATLPVSAEGVPAAGELRCNVAITLQGLKALGVPGAHIDMFPQEFLEGMEARAGLLGDVRSNHPNAWRRPVLHGATVVTEIDLGSVDVVVQYRCTDQTETLDQAIAELGAAPGLAILAIELMRSYPEAPNINREHFGFQDGISQPNPAAPEGRFWSDSVARGELFLGYANNRGDGPYPPRPDPLLDDGCFLVLRKIRQRLDVLDEVLKRCYPAPGKVSENARIELKERLMGRRRNGEPLVSSENYNPTATKNDFDYAADSRGAQCPFHAHARRTNPRTNPRIPRIIRRGMSYGPRDNVNLALERGTFFMAYCASIAEQFEVIQRWVTGGNSSGALSTQSDPFLGVPQAGDRRVYRFLGADGQVERVELGDKPFTELQWGMYLFVPSVSALKALETIVNPAAPPQHDLPAPTVPNDEESGNFRAWQRVLEDPSERDAAWRRVRQQKDGVLQTDYGRLIAGKDALTDVLQDSGKTHSVQGYGQRLHETLGLGYLGLDPDGGHTEQAEDSGVNQAIADIREEEAFNIAVMVTHKVLEGFKAATGQPAPSGKTETSVDLVVLSEKVLGALCTHWFGLPDGKFMVQGARTTELDPRAPVRCPGHFFSVARYVFSPHPSDTVEQDAKAHGNAILKAVSAFLEAAGNEKDPAQPKLTPLVQKIVDKLAQVKDGTNDLTARTVAGVMLGFPPTVHGNFVRILRAWIETGAHTDRSAPEPVTSVWHLQSELVAHGDERTTFGTARDVLLAPLIAQMRKAPVPEMIWREDPKHHSEAGAKTTPKVVLGLAGVMQDESADPSLMFGGARAQTAAAKAGAPVTVHACPGYEMAIGVMLGMVSAILLAGTLRPTASPTIFNLVTE
jgi:Dyp-type peroxidase family